MPPGTPLERAAYWLLAAAPDEETRIARGRSHVRSGIALAVAGLLAWWYSYSGGYEAQPPSLLGLALTCGVATLGLFAGSRLTRVAVLVLAVGFFLSLNTIPRQLHLMRNGNSGPPPAWLALRAVGSLLFVAGTLRATLTSYAFAWHRHRREARMAKREAKARVPKSLADWRRGEASDAAAER